MAMSIDDCEKNKLPSERTLTTVASLVATHVVGIYGEELVAYGGVQSSYTNTDSSGSSNRYNTRRYEWPQSKILTEGEQ